MGWRTRTSSLLVIILLAAWSAYAVPGIAMQSVAGLAPKPPDPPASGPGSLQYAHAGITGHVYGTGDSEYWIFEPADPTPKSAPVIVFNHGWSAMNPRTYGGWIKHLVGRGNIVIFPRYQATIGTRMAEFSPNAVAAVQAAMAELAGGAHVRPELDHFAIAGHSMGGAVTASMAALAKENRLPQPRAIMCVEPGNHVKGMPKAAMLMGDLHQIPPATLMLVIVGDADQMAGTDTALAIFHAVDQIPAANKDYVMLISDDHGTPALVGNHMAPVCFDSQVDDVVGSASASPGMRRRREPEGGYGFGSMTAYDYYGVWKLFDALTDAAFHGTNRQFALGNTPQQRFMGKWSDGVPVKELIVTQNP